MSYVSGTTQFYSNGSIDSVSLVPTPAPEPTTLAFLALSGLIVAARKFRNRR